MRENEAGAEKAEVQEGNPPASGLCDKKAGGGGGVHTAEGPGFQEMEAHVHTKTRTQMFTASLFIIAGRWKPPKCPLVDGKINKMWSI